MAVEEPLEAAEYDEREERSVAIVALRFTLRIG
jgi:hypothetical protein